MILFGKGLIRKAESKIFRGGVREKDTLARKAGSSGLSTRQMNEALKESGYDLTKRKSIMDKISGADKKKELSPEEIKSRILAARRSYEAGEAAEEFRQERYRFGGQYGQRGNRSKILGRAGGGVKGTATRRFGLGSDSTGFAGSAKPSSPAPTPSAPPRIGGGGGLRPGF